MDNLEFNIRDKVCEALDQTEVPYSLASKDEGDDVFIVYNTTEKPLFFSDDEEDTTTYKVTINIFSKFDFTELEKKVKKIMIDSGFTKDYYPPCQFIDNMGIYNQPLYFNYNVEGEKICQE